MELVEADNVEKMMMNVEKLAEIAVKVVWQGVSALLQ
ncbi:BnaA08g13210D [Brassica napus]|uniref:BnaA08g13210D protein n=2 Tax=Brassica napus TaxID=3708 RepID=A0A078FIC5_BRANA|nr:BnaA08g13210D [Brassica napus]